MSLYMVEHSYIQDPRVAVAIIAASLLSIWANYDADKMRADFRKANGKCNIWGKPAEYITAEYTTADGKTRESLLLVSGWCVCRSSACMCDLHACLTCMHARTSDDRCGHVPKPFSGIIVCSVCHVYQNPLQCK